MLRRWFNSVPSLLHLLILSLIISDANNSITTTYFLQPEIGHSARLWDGTEQKLGQHRTLGYEAGEEGRNGTAMMVIKRDGEREWEEMRKLWVDGESVEERVDELGEGWGEGCGGGDGEGKGGVIE